ncbi:MAG: polysaccharide lyase family protein [Kiritimatiellaeota bacterium]|nr:polysaccharide lyase family protein [Kiritimatiellota bacterium]
MRKTRLLFSGIVAGLLCHAGMAALPDVIFTIGKETHTPGGLALAKGAGWQQYAAVFKEPVVFTVGKSDAAKAWPYIHPSLHDDWAGNRLHPFAIRFTLAEKPAAPLTLVIGQVNSLKRPTILVSVNGKALPPAVAPEGSGDSSGVAEAPVRAERSLFAIAPDLFNVGDNEITVTVDKTSWIIYDFVTLCHNVPPPYVPPTIAHRLEEVRKGDYGAFEEIVFATRNLGPDGHWYANFGHYAYGHEMPSGPDDPRFVMNGDNRQRAIGPVYGSQGRLGVVNIKTGAIRLLIDDTEGAVRDPCVSYDARKIIFSYRKGGSPTFHLYEIGTDGANLRQLTDGGYDDIEPCYLPDGNIVFVSARTKRWVNCWCTEVATIHVCRADGSGIRPLSANIEQDNTPWPLHDGRLLYMRWEYIDRNQVNYHHLWTMNPDGTQHSVFFGNLHPGGLFIDAKPIPGSTDVIFIDSPGHGNTEHQGFVARVSSKEGPDQRQNLRRVSKGGNFRDPWALGDDLFFAARGREIVLLDNDGLESIMFKLPDDYKDCWLHEPRPILPRPREPLIADKTDHAKPVGTFILENVYEGRQMEGVAPGTVKKLIIMESLPKPINFTGGMDPLSYVGTFTLPRVLGTVPVDDDGSAHFDAPALRSLFFIALDAQGRAVKRMQSFTQVMPGEAMGCTGCHEERASAPRTAYATPGGVSASRRPPSAIDAADRAFDVPDFPRHVQPVLDRHCVTCHNPDTRKGGVDLCGDRGPMFSIAYHTLAVRHQIADGRNYAKSNYKPYELGSGGSALMQKLSGSHRDLKIPPEDAAAIALWLDASAPYPGTYAALGCGTIGGYQVNHQNYNNDRDWPTTKAAQPVYEKRCATCHTNDKKPLPRYLSDENGLSFWTPSMNDPKLTTSRHALFNLTRPDKSYFLKAPLAKEAGGLQKCKRDDGAPVFATTGDPDYQTLLKMIEAGRDRLDQIKRFDMPGFRPRIEYLREMKRYGILPPAFDLDNDPVDPYALDRLYWDSFIYTP